MIDSRKKSQFLSACNCSDEMTANIMVPFESNVINVLSINLFQNSKLFLDENAAVMIVSFHRYKCQSKKNGVTPWEIYSGGNSIKYDQS